MSRMTGGAMLLAIKRNGKWERTNRLDRLCWRLGPTFISLNRRLDYFRDRWFPRAEATDIALEANPAKDGTAKPAEQQVVSFVHADMIANGEGR